MNPQHMVLCSSQPWIEHVENDLLPWVFEAVQPPARMLEIGPGPGATTNVLRHRVKSLTCVEFDADLAQKLAERFAGDGRVAVGHADGSALPFPANRFEAAAAFTMLHHVPSIELQDHLFAEAARVLLPGGVFFGVDSLDSPGFRRLHEGDICVPVNPLTLEKRLHEAGFESVDVGVQGIGVRFIARMR